MRTLYLDCGSGVSGDMFTGALIDLGVAFEDIRRAVEPFGVTCDAHKVTRCGVVATKFNVTFPPQHEHRHLADVQALFDEPVSGGSPPPLPDAVKRMSMKVFGVIAEAEGKIHGLPPEKVHFHEVGALDSVTDIAAGVLCVHLLRPDRVMVSVLREGQGFVRCAHGLVPVPAPATLEIIRRFSLPVMFTETPGELVTPTGAGLVAVLGDAFGGVCPSGKVTAVGYGAGSKEFDEHPNVLRAMMIEHDG